MNLYILNYNNYYNRIVKFEKSLQDYLQYQVGDAIQSVAFNPNDGVDTIQIVNKPVSGLGNYILCVNDNDVLDSRWFIMESTRLRNGQYRLTLRRDLIVDSYDKIINAPCFVEKATVGNSDPAIFNKENMTFNQIKKSEVLLKDGTGCSWIVGYLADKTVVNETEVTFDIGQPFADLNTFIADWNALKSYSITDNNRNLLNNAIVFDYDFSFRVRFALGGYLMNGYCYEDGTYKTSTIGIQEYNYLRATNTNAIQKLNQLVQQNKSIILNQIDSGYNINSIDNISKYNGKIVYDSTSNKYYRVNFETKTIDNYLASATKLTPTLMSTMNNLISQDEYFTGSTYWGYQFAEGTYNDDSVGLNMNISYLTFSLNEVSGRTAKYSIPSTVNSLQDAPYIMFAIPYGQCKLSYMEDAEIKTINISEENAVTVADIISANITSQLGGSSPKLYDIQLLPYCPLQDNIKSDGTIYLNNSKFYSKITSNNEVIDLILFPTSSRFTFDIPYDISISNYKVSNECDVYRLCSPNHNGQFEFSPAKNGGVNLFNVDCEYKPFQPYIHLNPNFKGLYGQDFNDARGLICNGDFSLTQTSDAWATYQRQFVNYDKIFNREIQNMEFQNNMQNRQSLVNIGAGTVSAIGTGAIMGGPIGAVLGGAISAGAGALDYNIQKQQQEEALDYKRDMFGYQLGNVQALPNSLTKVSALNNNFKKFPFLEYYTCTEEEKNALINKIKYNGMTVMRIGTISEFIREEKSYIKGQLIRLEGINEDYHYINEISQEIYKGVFI